MDVIAVLHIGLITWNSTIKTTAAMITAASAALGIYRRYGVRNCNDTKTRRPVYIPPKVVLTPEEWLTAPRLSPPLTGIDDTKEEITLHTPNANIS